MDFLCKHKQLQLTARNVAISKTHSREKQKKTSHYNSGIKTRYITQLTKTMHLFISAVVFYLFQQFSNRTVHCNFSKCWKNYMKMILGWLWFHDEASHFANTHPKSYMWLQPKNQSDQSHTPTFTMVLLSAIIQTLHYWCDHMLEPI